MKQFVHILSCCLLATLPLSAQKKPNIVIIYADDQGWKDVGYQSNGEFQTPVLDNMAKQVMIFTDAYTNAANCQPARACLLSGNYTPRHHVFADGVSQGRVHNTPDGIGPPKNLRTASHHFAACHACYPRPHIIDPVTGTKSLPLDSVPTLT